MRIRRLSLRGFWDRVHAVNDVFHLLPPVAAIVIAVLLAFIGQLYEIYYSYLETPAVSSVVAAIIGMGMVSVALHASHYWLSRIRVNETFSVYQRPRIPIRYRRVRKGVGWLLAFLPWFGLAAGMAWAERNIYQHHARLDEAVNLLGARLPGLPPGVLTLMAGGVVLTFVLGLVVATLIHLLRRNHVVFLLLAACAVGWVVFTALMPSYLPDSVSIYRQMGPLAAQSVAILLIYSVVVLLALFSQGSRYPALAIVIGAIAVGGIFETSFSHVLLFLMITFAALAMLAGLAIAMGFVELWSNFGIAAVLCAIALVAYHRDSTAAVWNYDPNMRVADAKQRPSVHKDVQDVFGQWLAQRKAAPRAAAAGKRYPVFIVAIEGGGIYASAAGAMFLAKVQDDCPDFAEHIFAISAVSGGAIGASVFQALARTKPEPGPEVNCGMFSSGDEKAAPAGDLQQKISKIMQDDHFSPIVGAIVPDLFGETTGRAQELEASFLGSVAAVDPAAAARLRDWYINHWNDGAAPALVLNTTSAETGYRVAFAPFFLSKSGSKTLFSLSDHALTNEFDEDQPIGEDVPLMFAAVASARFPLILPPFAISLRPNKANGAGNRWNFVDGGYADNSGAETALDLYGTLEQELYREKVDNVDLKVIILTSDDASPPFSKIIGTTFGDTLAPIQAVLNVRSGLGNQAVTRICDFFRQRREGTPAKPAGQVEGGPQRPSADEECGSDRGEGWKIKLIKLQDEAYGLALGWKISRSSFQVVSEFVAHTDYCRAPTTRFLDPDLTNDERKQITKSAQEIANNSCTLQDIETALRPFAATAGRGSPPPRAQ